MAQSLMYIGKLTGFYWSRYLPAEFSEMLLGFFFVRRRKFRAQVLAVEKPVLSLGILGRTDESGTIFLFVALEVIPHSLVLDYVGVRIDYFCSRIDHRHSFSLREHKQAVPTRWPTDPSVYFSKSRRLFTVAA